MTKKTNVTMGDTETEQDSWWLPYKGACECGEPIAFEVGDLVPVRANDSGECIAHKCGARRCGRTTWIYEHDMEAAK